MAVVELRNVSKAYAIYDRPADRLKELLTLNRLKRHREFWALKNVSFKVEPGETFCILGQNGSGKSTLLQIIAGILQPTSGQANVQGRLSALLELGSGFNPEFTGQQNVMLNASILGLTRDQIEQRLPSIEAFAEIGEFIDQPVKTYSSGMAMRLAFSVAIHVDPQILLIDEALAVGDIYFRHRCLRRIHELRKAGTTILFVSHAISDVKAIGHRALWLEHGHIQDIGPVDSVVAKYAESILAKDRAALETEPATPADTVSSEKLVTHVPNVDHRHGSGRAQILGIAILNEKGQPIASVDVRQTIVIRISIEAKSSVAQPNIGFMLRNHLGVDFSGTNTLREEVELPAMRAGETATVDFRLQLPELYPGSFTISPAIADGDLLKYDMCDWIDNAIAFQILRGENEVYGYLHLPCEVTAHG
jgi:lipopolysaccharide transport system ATP-binding protein